MFNILFKNPETIRYFRSRLRLKTVITTTVIIVAILLFIGVLAIGSLEKHPTAEEITKRWHVLFMVYASFALLVGYALGTGSTATSVVGEKEKKTYDFLFLTPLSDTTLSVGKLLGSIGLTGFVLLVMFPFILIAGAIGDVNAIRLILFYLVLITGTLFFASLGLLVSVSVNKTANAQAGALGLLIIIVCISSIFLGETAVRFLSILSPIPLMREIGEELVSSGYYYYRKPYINEVSFFGLQLNGAWLTTLCYLYLTFWAIVAIARKIRNPIGTYLSKAQAIIFFLVFEVFMVGAIWKYSRLPVSSELLYKAYDFLGVLYAYTFTHILLLGTISLGLSLSYDDYFAYVRAKVAKRPLGLLHPRAPSHLLFGLFFIIMLGGCLIALRSFSLPKSIILHLTVALEIVAIFYLVTQLFKAFMKNYGAVVAVLLFMAANTLPPLVIAVFELPEKYYLYLNPVAYLVQIDSPYVFLSNREFFFLPILLFVLLLVIMGFFIKQHYTIKKAIIRRAQA